jgi:hemolysin III
MVAEIDFASAAEVGEPLRMSVIRSAYTPREELANVITHGFGTALSVVGLAVLVTFAALHGDAWHVVSAAVFGLTLVLLYTASTLYHAFRDAAKKRVLRKFDHAGFFCSSRGLIRRFCW